MKRGWTHADVSALASGERQESAETVAWVIAVSKKKVV